MATPWLNMAFDEPIEHHLPQSSTSMTQKLWGMVLNTALTLLLRSIWSAMRVAQTGISGERRPFRSVNALS
uniref:hypothetical protein n=1 Tax=Thaumasiovibrio occultus TaxID=1891184 RepID=UPI000B35F174|nr:hypothetical protein [Thaumasiovibrio occultus]